MKEQTLRRSLDLTRFYQQRSRDARKGDYGRVIIVGGSDQYAGCLTFNALAALRAGADTAVIIAPRRAADTVARHSPDLITVPCQTPFPNPRVAREFLSRADSLIIGCGVTRTPAAHNALLSVIRDCKAPIVADAEALHALASQPNACNGKRMLLTPNPGEYQALAGTPWPRSPGKRSDAVKSLATRYRASVIVKGAQDFISDGTRSYIDNEGSPYMTKGGYGDLLAGAAGALLARGQDPFESAKGAAYIIGRAGSMASEKLGEGMLASDVLQQLPAVIRLTRKGTRSH